MQHVKEVSESWCPSDTGHVREYRSHTNCLLKGEAVVWLDHFGVEEHE
jgi:hypothetical protein